MVTTLRFRILLVVTGIIFATTLTLMLTVQWQTKRSIDAIQEENARNLLKAIELNVQNEYKSIVFFKERSMHFRKTELKDIVDVAFGVLNECQQKVKNGVLSKVEAQELAKEIIRQMRYDNGVGYLWINDTTTPYPVMVMHPTLPELDGKILNDLKYNCALGKDENLFRAFNNVCRKYGRGFVDYLWPKPTPEGLTSEQPKLSFVRLFRPWNWIVGTGVYIDDIESDTQDRVNAVLHELKETCEKTHIGKSGYMFVFNGNKKMLIHPKLAGQDLATIRNPDTGRYLLGEIILASNTEEQFLDYRWVKPKGDEREYYWKRMYVTYFKPLDWYICVSYYHDEIEATVWNLSIRLLIISACFLGIAFVLSMFLSKSLSAPLKKLANAAEKVATAGVAGVQIPISGSKETRELGHVLADTLDKIGQKEKYIKTSKENLRITLDSIGDAVIATDTEGRIVRMNKVAEQLTAWPFQLAKGHVLYDGVKLLDTETNVPLDNPINKVLKEGIACNLSKKTTMITYDKKFKLISDSCSPIISTEGELIGVVMAFRDIEEQSRLEEQLHQSQKMDSLGQLAGGVAHDFNNMLAGIIGAAELLRSKMIKENSQYIKYINVIVDTGERAAELTDKLLAFSRKGKMLSTPIDINESITDAIAILERSIDKRIKIVESFNAEDSTVIGDPSQIQNIIINLGVNAGHAMPKGGTLSITTNNTYLDDAYCNGSSFKLVKGEYVQISIQDSGVGISNNLIDKIFEPFFTTKGVGAGTGLGLAAVYGTVKEHHGAITVYSEVNKGSIFNIYLPVSYESTVVKTLDIAKEYSGSGCILVVDDESILRFTAKNTLEDLGYNVMLAANGIEAIEIYKNNREQIDLVILDMVMPEMDGKDCFFALQKVDPQVKVLLTSGFTNDTEITSLKNQGLIGFVKKPYRRAELSIILAKIL